MTSVEKIDSAIDRLLYLKGLALTTKTTAACAHIDQAFEEVLFALHSVEAEKEPEWISCDERLPAEHDADFNGEVWIAGDWISEKKFLVDKIEYFRAGEYGSRDTHWKPTGLRRPAPPEHKPE